MNDHVSIEFYSDSKPDRLIELSKTTYNDREISNMEYLQWEYKRNPDGEAVISVAEADKKIISQYLVLPRLFYIDKKIVTGSLSANTLTHPDFRDRGLFTKLANETFKRCRDKGIEFTIGFPNPVSLPVIEKKKIFETAGYLPFLFLPLNPFSAFLKYVSGRAKKNGGEVDFSVSEKIFTDEDSVSIFDFVKDKDKYEIFIKHFNDEKQNVTFRSLEFLKWRYIDIPLRNYIILKLEREDRISAIAVFRARYMYGIRCGILVDIAALENIYEVRNIINVVKKISKENKLDLIITTVPDHSTEYKYLKHAGFYNLPQSFLPQKLALIVQKHLPACSNSVTEFRKWFLTFGDYDIF